MNRDVIHSTSYLSQIKDEKGVLLTAVTIYLDWHDDYLIWEDIAHIEYYKNSSVQLPKSYLWTPDIFVWNTAGQTQMIKVKNDSLLKVFPSGMVTVEIYTLLDTECEMSVLKYATTIGKCFVPQFLSQFLH